MARRYTPGLLSCLLILSACPQRLDDTVTSSSSSSTSSASSTSGTSGVAPTTLEASATGTSSSDAFTTGDPGPECGNGVVEEGEDCDDGNIDQHDDCLNSCTWASCGDGKVHDGVENCDDGNVFDDDGCPTTCDFARCGDGFTQLGVEECDDANEDPNDGCDDACIRTRVAFVTSDNMLIGDFGGIAGADSICRELAAAADLENAETFKAWLSDETGAPGLDFHRSKGRYALVTGIPIADDWDDLTDGTLLSPIIVDEHGELVLASGVFTNTSASGAPIDSQYSCGNWSSDEGDTWHGFCGATNYEWTDSVLGNPTSCGAPARLYCFEQ